MSCGSGQSIRFVNSAPGCCHHRESVILANKISGRILEVCYPICNWYATVAVACC